MNKHIRKQQMQLQPPIWNQGETNLCRSLRSQAEDEGCVRARAPAPVH